MSNMRKPIIGLVSCRKEVEGYQVQSLNELYLKAIKDFGGTSIILPLAIEPDETERLLTLCDGLLFPGSHSNVAPHHYNGTHEEAKKDEVRDSFALQIMRLAIDKNIPCLGVCRGFQEMNVALGGSLEPAVHNAGFNDHRERSTPNFEEKYAPAHPVIVEDGGILSQWLTEAKWANTQQFDVNTLHNQGVKELASSLRVEAKAPDGLVEAFSLPGQRFFVGVQWHPEWQAKHNHFSQILFREFITAASK